MIPPHSKPVEPARKRQRGNAFVETGLVLLPFMALVLGITDYSLALFVRSTMQHAVREGARYAITFQTLPTMCQDASIKEIVRRNSMGFLKSADLPTKVFIRYYLPTTLAETANNFPGNIVEVSVENYQWRWIAPIWRSTTPMTVLARASDRMEGLPGGTSAPCR
jgi:Flp pilus assembly protein TadG